MGRLDGRVALITGGARGMGKSHVRHFVAEGAQVIFGDVLDDKGGYVADKLGRQSCRYTHLDVTSEADWGGGGSAGDGRIREAGHAGQQRRHPAFHPDRRHAAGRLLAGARGERGRLRGVLTRMVLDQADGGHDGDRYLANLPLARFAEPTEISRLVAYLASDESSYSTGSEFTADGGLLSGPGY